MKKLDPILHWDDYFIEGYALFLMILGWFHPWIFIILGMYLLWQRRNIKVFVLLIGVSSILIRFYVFDMCVIPQTIHGEAKITDIKSIEYSDMIIMKYQGNRYQAFVDQEIYEIGDIVVINAVVKSYRNQTIPYGFNQKNYYLSQNVKGYLEINSIDYVRHSFSFGTYREQLDEYLSHFQSKNYMKALLLGEKSFTEEQSSLYKNLGILYLFTVSGLHIYGLMHVIRKIFFYLSLSEKTQFILTMMIFLLILYFNQFSLSVLRIALIFLFQYFSKRMKMNLSHLDIIHLVFFTMLILQIEWIYNLGFLMLFIISNMIDLMSHIYQNLNIYLKRLMLSIIIILCIIPFQTYISPFFILLLPVIMMILTGPVYILAIVVIFIPELDQLLWMLIKYLELFMKWLEYRNISMVLPAMPIFGIVLYYLMVIALFRSQSMVILFKRSLFILILFAYFVMDIKITNEINFYMIDVGQGDSILIESPNCNLLIDSFQNVLPMMNDLGMTHLDYLILTHSDNDHIMEAQDIIDHTKVNQVIINPYNVYPIHHQHIIPMKSDDALTCGSMLIHFLGPIRAYDNINNNALVFKMHIGNQNFIFTGDIEKEAEDDLILKYGHALKSDVLKVAHHGSKTSTSSEFIRYVNPDIALISVGEHNRYGFPSEQVIQLLMMSDIDIYRTDTMGTIVYTYHQKKEKWSMYLPF